MKQTKLFESALSAASFKNLIATLFAVTFSCTAANAQSIGGGDPLAGRVAPVISNHVLAIGSLTAKGNPNAVREVLKTEVEDTVRLYLTGKLDQWFFKPDDGGVVFVFNATDMAEVDAQLKALPLSRGGLMEFQLIRLAPLRPLGVLLTPAK